MPGIAGAGLLGVLMTMLEELMRREQQRCRGRQKERGEKPRSREPLSFSFFHHAP